MTKAQLIVNLFWSIATTIILFLDIQGTISLANNSALFFGYIILMFASFGAVKVIDKKQAQKAATK
ncbi:MAG TPA: hypothetical protein DCY20_10530 [Firmicutes bacterium]|nr:hypothetical protein [Bacillota bacterium]